MAGAGFKDFAVGEVLTASDVDTYLMQQTVMRFADSAARGSALGTATGAGTALAEGMVSYLDDANYVQVYNGSGWTSAIPGVGINVVQATKTDAFVTTSTSYQTVTGLSVTITPTSATSKILLLAQVSLSGDNGRGDLRISGGNATNYVDGVGAAFSWIGRNSSVLDLERTVLPVSLIYLDSPATTSATTYVVEARTAATSSININERGSDGTDSGTSSLTAIEVAA